MIEVIHIRLTTFKFSSMNHSCSRPLKKQVYSEEVPRYEPQESRNYADTAKYPDTAKYAAAASEPKW